MSHRLKPLRVALENLALTLDALADGIDDRPIPYQEYPPLACPQVRARWAEFSVIAEDAREAFKGTAVWLPALAGLHDMDAPGKWTERLTRLLAIGLTDGPNEIGTADMRRAAMDARHRAAELGRLELYTAGPDADEPPAADGEGYGTVHHFYRSGSVLVPIGGDGVPLYQSGSVLVPMDDEPAPAVADGPFDPYSFAWDGRTREFPTSEGRLYRLLTAMWKPPTVLPPGGCRTLDDVAAEVIVKRTAGATANPKSIKNHIPALNVILAGHFGMPYLLASDRDLIRWVARD